MYFIFSYFLTANDQVYVTVFVALRNDANRFSSAGVILHTTASALKPKIKGIYYNMS